MVMTGETSVLEGAAGAPIERKDMLEVHPLASAVRKGTWASVLGYRLLVQLIFVAGQCKSDQKGPPTSEQMCNLAGQQWEKSQVCLLLLAHMPSLVSEEGSNVTQIG